ncbi:ectoine/hydroxyectoine ABC transporter permease subunit EhuC [Bradyrhizobium japonicum]|uniref:ectoine/hydroxyectoine ABC transporter permease subunit EhuC n=1 Tax=Bradyrhizobium japonicum TaxID=375 RepID=UPI00057661F5|nr:ectoine/hydroxyectoine ABC transporter permease subunit EhuC [Bradyrhizobium japonicum]
MTEYWWFILKGAGSTISITLLSCVLALFVSFASGIALLSKRFLVRACSRIYVEVFRGTSVFVQLFVAYYVLPLVGLKLSPIVAGTLALGFNGGAYAAEVVRSAILAVGRDQREASIAVNLTRWQMMRWIILPQAFVIMLPSFGNIAIEIMKGTAAASLISVPELTFQAQTVRAHTGETAFPFILILISYLAIASVIMAVVRWLERKFGRGIIKVGA